MKDQVSVVRSAVVLLLASLAGVVWLVPAAAGTSSSSEYLRVSFLAVGQGDAIFIETPDGAQLLIDGGADSAVLRELSGQMPLGDRSIDVVLATHPDLDHIGGLIDVLGRYQVETIIRTENENDTTTSEVFAVAVGAEGADQVYARRGQRIHLGASTTVEILSPAGPTDGWESNNSSIIVQVRYGDIEFMLTGDAPSEIEDYLVEQFGEQLESEVLKLGHHGSKTSTSELFLDVVDPKFAIVSAGADNRYGHPHPEVVGRTIVSGAEVLETAEDGTITLLTDGKEVWLKQ